MRNKVERLFKQPEPFFSAFTTLIIFLLIIAIKGIFPFGGNRIDYYDLGQEFAPVYYHIWDFLHGKSSLLYNWYIEEGQNFTMCKSLLSVYNLFFLFIPRRYVLHSLSLFLGLHLFFMTFNMNIFLRRVVPSNRFCRYMMSVAYGLCGFTLTHYTALPFIDVAALAPIYLLTMTNLLIEKPKSVRLRNIEISCILPYSIMTAYMTILSYYLEFMNLLFILLISGTYLIILCPRQNKKSVAFRMCIGTLTGLMMSMWMLIPTALQLTGTSRLSENTKLGLFDSIMQILRAIGADMYYIKWWQLSGSIAAIAAIMIGVILYRKERKLTLFLILACFFPCALIPFESINLIFHLGIYFQYPVRCGYWIALILLSVGAYYLSRISDERNKQEKEHKSVVRTIVCGILSLCGCIAVIAFYQMHDTWDIHSLFKAWVVFVLVLAMIYFCIILITGNIRYLMLVMVVELVCGAYIGYGQPHFYDKFSSQPEQSGDFILKTQELKDDLEVTESKLERIKNPDTSLNANYGMVLRRASFGGHFEGVTGEQRDQAETMGYSIHFTRILDSGGTIFTDAIFNVSQIITCTPFFCENDAYRFLRKNNGFSLYDSVYRFPFAVTVSSDITTRELPTDLVRAHNMYYEALSGEQKAIMTETNKGELYIDGKQALYIAGSAAERITVNDSIIPVPTIGNIRNVSYPEEFNCNLLFAGIYENETVHIEGMRDLKVYTLDLEAMEELCDKLKDEETHAEMDGECLVIDIRGDKNRDMVLIPMCYDRGFKGKVNGKRSDIYNIGELFMGIPIEEGKNHVELRFVPRGLIFGLFISMAALALTVNFAIKPVMHRVLDDASYIMFVGLWWIALTVLYAIPVIAFIIHQIVKRLPISVL